MKYLLLMIGLMLTTSSCSKTRKVVDNSQRTSESINVQFVDQLLQASEFLKENKVVYFFPTPWYNERYPFHSLRK